MDEWSYNYYWMLAFFPAAIHSLLMVTRYDMTSVITWLSEASLFALGVFCSKFVYKEKVKNVKHILISANYQELIIGVENLSGQSLGETLPPNVQPIPSTTYTKVSLDNILFLGYSQTYSKVQAGSPISDVEAKTKVSLEEYNKDPQLIGEVLKLGFNKKKLL